MAGSVNKVILVGNLGKDPEVRTLASGDRVANLSIATSETWRDRQSGERKEKTEWHRVVVFNDRLVGVIEQYVKKGDKIYVEGKLETRKWADQSGNEKYTTEVVLRQYGGEIQLLGSKGEGRQGGDDRGGYQQEAPRQASPRAAQPQRQAPQRAQDLDDEIPF